MTPCTGMREAWHVASIPMASMRWYSVIMSSTGSLIRSRQYLNGHTNSTVGLHVLSMFCINSATPTYLARTISWSVGLLAELKYSRAEDNTNSTDSLNGILQTKAVFFFARTSEEIVSVWTGSWCELQANNWPPRVMLLCSPDDSKLSASTCGL